MSISTLPPTLLGLLSRLVGSLLVNRRGVVCWELGVFLLLTVLFSLLNRLNVLLVESNWLVALATELGNGDSDEASKSHTNEVGQSTNEDSDENGDEDS